jgi:hypothetical protein
VSTITRFERDGKRYFPGTRLWVTSSRVLRSLTNFEDEFIFAASLRRRVVHETFRLPELLRTKMVTCSTPATINQVVIPCTRGLTLFLLAICPLAGATTYRIHAGQGSSVIQRVISGASAGDTVSFDAGTYTITSTLRLKCGLTITGPVVANFTTPTAQITITTANASIFSMTGGCSNVGTVEYINFNNGGPIYFDTAGYSNFNFLHNAVTSLPYSAECDAGTCAAESLFFDGNVENTNSNITIEYNLFGDNNSCTAGLHVDSGACSGLNFNVVGIIQNLVIKYNVFHHLQEGMHFEQVSWAPNEDTSTCEGCDIEFNYFYDNYRIALEDQASSDVQPTTISNNVFGPPAFTENYSSMAISAACCLTGRSTSAFTTLAQTPIIQNNVIWNDGGGHPDNQTYANPIGIELQGPFYVTQNLIDGNFCTGIAYGSSIGNAAINYNTVLGHLMATNRFCIFYNAAFLGTDGDSNTPNYIIGNVTGSTPTSYPSVAPTISPASGSVSFPLTVTLKDPGYTSSTSTIPNGNTGIWYTTDGSTPIPGSGTAQYLASGGSFVLSAPATVKAVGMWGVPPQPTSYPVGYGFVPSAVKSAPYTSWAANQQRRPR